MAVLKWVIGYSPFGIKRPREARTARPIGSLAYNALSVASSSGMPERPCGSANPGPRGQRDESRRLAAIRMETVEHVRVGKKSWQNPDEKRRGHRLGLKPICPVSENASIVCVGTVGKILISSLPVEESSGVHDSGW